jgi:HAD domain in Swiss Army Knife RNA repair proteins
VPGAEALPRPDGGGSPAAVGATGPTGASGTAGGVGGVAEAFPGVANFPTRSELAKLPPALRRKLQRAAFDTELRGQRLRRLRDAIQARRGCLGVLPRDGRRTLELRAGLFGRDPASRRVVARRIGTSPTAVLRIERSSLRRLLDADERGLCDGGSGPAALGGPSAGSSDGPDGAPGDPGGGSDPQASSSVLADIHEGGPGIDLGDGQQGPTEALLFFLLTLCVLLGPLAVAALISQRRAANGVAAEAGKRPLLFLDVDGVIALDPLSNDLSPGRIRASPLGLAYVPDRVGPLVRELATRFDIVWATGWEHYANAGLSAPLGLREDLPVLTFGGRARPGSAKWKIKRVDDYAGHRPVAWLDDNFVGRHSRWAAHRSAPTMLMPVDAQGGLAQTHVEQLLRWADRLTSQSGEGGIRTLEGRCRP